MVLARSAMEVPLCAESAKCFLSLSAPQPRDHSCKSRLLSSQKRRVLSAGYSPPDRRELPQHPPVRMSLKSQGHTICVSFVSLSFSPVISARNPETTTIGCRQKKSRSSSTAAVADRSPFLEERPGKESLFL